MSGGQLPTNQLQIGVHLTMHLVHPSYKCCVTTVCVGGGGGGGGCCG